MQAPPENGKGATDPHRSAPPKNLSSFAGPLNQTTNDSRAALQARSFAVGFAFGFYSAAVLALIVWGARV